MMVLPPWFSGMSCVVTHAVPQFLRDERQERMEQPQRVAEDEVNDGEGVGRCSVAADVSAALIRNRLG